MAVVITHPEMGIYLGNCMGLGFWSKIDAVGQPSAVTFVSKEDATEFMKTWDGGVPEGVDFKEVVPADGGFASIAACVAAGLEPWLIEESPAANEIPC
ncbi:hypothetical protein [Polaromonas sp.]|uniref:hypothetical protein n=1 Tax=Polaromonas sp. TaxID=1869339 RepID=UPI00352BC416